MANLSDLPEELKLLICEKLILITPSQESVGLLTVNKHFYSLVFPLLWRYVHVPSRRYLHRKFCAFIVVKGRKIAPLIRKIRIDTQNARGYDLKDEGLYKRKGLKDEVVLTSLQERVGEIFGRDEDRCDEWQEEVGLQNTNYLIPLSLVHLPNLESLRMTNSTIGDEDEVWTKLKDIAAYMLRDGQLDEDQRPFQNLHKIHIDGPLDKYGSYSTAIAMAATLPMIQSIHAVHTVDADDEYPDQSFTELMPRSINLNTVDLFHNCKLSGEHLQLFLGASYNLRTFRYHMGQPWAWITFRSVDVQRALEPHKKTLENVVLCIDTHEFESDDSLQLQPMNFREFSRLEHLCIGMPFLHDRRIEAFRAHVLVESLPLCIRFLRVVQVEMDVGLQWLESSLKELVKRKQQFPVLAMVQVSCSKGTTDQRKYELAHMRLEKCFLGSSITLQISREDDLFTGWSRSAVASDMGLQGEVADDSSDYLSYESSNDETVEDSDDWEDDSEEEQNEESGDDGFSYENEEDAAFLGGFQFYQF